MTFEGFLEWVIDTREEDREEFLEELPRKLSTLLRGRVPPTHRSAAGALTLEAFLDWTADASRDWSSFLRDFAGSLFALFRHPDPLCRRMVAGSKLPVGRRKSKLRTRLKSLKNRLTRNGKRA